MWGSRRRQALCVPLRYRINCFTARKHFLLWDWGLVWIVVGWGIACLVSKVTWRWVFRRLCGSWSNRDHPVELLSRAPSLSNVCQDWLLVSSFVNQYRFNRDSTRSVLFFTSKPLRVLVISGHKKLTVSPSWRYTTTSVKCRLVFVCSKIIHEMFVRSNALRHPCDAGESNLLIVVHVSSHT